MTINAVLRNINDMNRSVWNTGTVTSVNCSNIITSVYTPNLSVSGSPAPPVINWPVQLQSGLIPSIQEWVGLATTTDTAIGSGSLVLSDTVKVSYQELLKEVERLTQELSLRPIPVATPVTALVAEKTGKAPIPLRALRRQHQQIGLFVPNRE
jgi:hypothetical protein